MLLNDSKSAWFTGCTDFEIVSLPLIISAARYLPIISDSSQGRNSIPASSSLFMRCFVILLFFLIKTSPVFGFTISSYALVKTRKSLGIFLKYFPPSILNVSTW